MTALELLDLLESDPDGAWTDVEMERLSGIAAAGDVDPTLARQFVYGRLLLEAAGVDFSEGRTLSAGALGIPTAWIARFGRTSGATARGALCRHACAPKAGARSGNSATTPRRCAASGPGERAPRGGGGEAR